ncbi:PRC-barrel domain-containing protein [Paeniglutamicibacter sp. R2-26]|uniref:PRC-barrel domain-containing protein n=1 Tax=Paeniglutamicibacter sp. R2-26 TaxID=3144417 RepID=UPI003EE7D770
MLGREELRPLLEDHAPVVGPTGERIGTAGHLLIDARTGEPGFVTVDTGLFGTAHSIAPLAGAGIVRGVLHLAYDKDTVRHAPNIDPVAELGLPDEDRLFAYYGMEPGPRHGAHAADAPAAHAGRSSGFETEERVIAVDDAQGRPLLRKYVVTATEAAPEGTGGTARRHARNPRHEAPPEPRTGP